MTTELEPGDITKEEFKAIREYLKLTQVQFAEKLGYKDYRSILRKETGAIKLTYRDFSLLKDWLPVIRALQQPEK